MDNKKIEKAAVNRVRDLIQQCDTIDDKLDEDDKNILTDGVLDLYSSTDQTVDNLRAQIPVQVRLCPRLGPVSGPGDYRPSDLSNCRGTAPHR